MLDLPAPAITCHVCGHLNDGDAPACSQCGQVLDPGIRRGINCPRCGALNPAGTIECEACSWNLELVDKEFASNRTRPCLQCQSLNPATLPFAPAYCIGCGSRLVADDDNSILKATPDRDQCPICDHKGISVKKVFAERLVQPRNWFAPPNKPLLLQLFGAQSDEEDWDYLGNSSNSDITETGGSADSPSLPVEARAGLTGLGILQLWGYYRSGGWILDLILFPVKLVWAPLHERWERDAFQYQRAARRWNGAYYCTVDNIVYHREIMDLEFCSPEGFLGWMRG